MARIPSLLYFSSVPRPSLPALSPNSAPSAPSPARPTSPLMNHLHDAHVHNKRISINELLNPIGATASPLYSNQQLPCLSAALQYAHPRDAPRQDPAVLVRLYGGIRTSLGHRSACLRASTAANRDNRVYDRLTYLCTA
ncbi:hypothetical protein C8T65DRAFT_697061 [Cerioporus squamosus]|nr:hypothetical protein C8T65DRAFT_697061 [Cerioporus squamosus]